MARRLVVLFVLTFSSVALVCQDPSGGGLDANGGPSALPAPSRTDAMIPQDMPVELRLLEGLSTMTDHRGYVVHLEVAADVMADGVVVVPAGTRTTVKLTHADGRIEFSEPKLTVGGRDDLRLSRLTSRERGELSAEEGAAIGIAIFGAPVIAVMLPIQAVWGAAHAIHEGHKKGPKQPRHYVTMEPGESFRYYAREKTPVKIAAASAITP